MKVRSKEQVSTRDNAPAPDAGGGLERHRLLAEPGAAGGRRRLGGNSGPIAAIGLVMAAGLLFYLFDGRLERIYLEPVVHFKYPFFAWVEGVASPGVMQAVLWLGLAAALAAGRRLLPGGVGGPLFGAGLPLPARE